MVDQNGFKYGAIKLPEDAGTFVTNLAFHDGYLYITESSKNEIWRIKVNKEGLGSTVQSLIKRIKNAMVYVMAFLLQSF